MNKTKQLSLRVLSLLFALVMLLSLVACGTNGKSAVTTAATTVAQTTEAPPKYEIRLTSPQVAALHTEVQAGYLADPDPHSVISRLRTAYAAKSVDYDAVPGTIELGRPKPIALSWTVPESARGHVTSFTLRIWTAADCSDLREISLGADATGYSFFNAYIGTTYYWNVCLLDDEGSASESETASFTTADEAPRNLCVDGVTNVRDVGGWPTEDGGRVRQGLLYRGARFNPNFKTEPSISAAGIRTLCDEIKIKTELDLRRTTAVSNNDESGDLTASVLGDGVTYLAYPMEYGDKLITDARNIERVRQVFALLADESNYPIYFHCSIGTDRTGLIAWLVNGLCGVSEEDLWRDYLFSDFGTIEAARTREKNEGVYVNKIKEKDGDNFAEKTYHFLKDYFKVPESDLQSVIRIMKEAPAAK